MKVCLGVLSILLFMGIAVAEEEFIPHICDQGCAVDEGCRSDDPKTPYLCKRSSWWPWSDKCVPQGYDYGYCGGKTDEGGFCRECDQGCFRGLDDCHPNIPLNLPCGPDEYCCRKSIWAHDCVPRGFDMGCCGGPTAKETITTLEETFKATGLRSCTSKIMWQVKEDCLGDWVDVSADCEEGNYREIDLTVNPGESKRATCTSKKIPSKSTGPHCANVSWCGVVDEFEYGEKSPQITRGETTFLISDKNWRDILPLVPIAVKTEGKNDVIVSPLLIYQINEDEFSTSYGTTSIMHFLRMYKPEKLTLVGETPQMIKDMLVTGEEGTLASPYAVYAIIGAGLSEDQIEEITPNDYFSYWESYDKIVYVEDSYELALMASTYASLTNAPLVIKNTAYDVDNVFNGIKIICVGDPGRECNEKYTLDELRREYLKQTKTDKIILINPDDINKEWNYYKETSLAAPILASAKHELILSTIERDGDKIDEFLDSKIKQIESDLKLEIKYLTIVASSDYVPYESDGGYGSLCMDFDKYGNTDEDFFMELAVGRITTYSLSGVSSYVARAIFYPEIKLKKDNVLIENLHCKPEQYTQLLSQYFEDYCIFYAEWRGYRWGLTDPECKGNKACIIQRGNGCFEDPIIEREYLDNRDGWVPDPLYKGKTFISIEAHGNPTEVGYYMTGISGFGKVAYPIIPYQDNPIVYSDGCSTCATYGDFIEPLCFYALERGSIAYFGAIHDFGGRGTPISSQLGELFNGFYREDKTIGDIWKDLENRDRVVRCEGVSLMLLAGDPTIKYGYPLRSPPREKADIKLVADYENQLIYDLGEVRVEMKDKFEMVDKYNFETPSKFNPLIIDYGAHIDHIGWAELKSESGCLDITRVAIESESGFEHTYFSDYDPHVANMAIDHDKKGDKIIVSIFLMQAFKKECLGQVIDLKLIIHDVKK